MKGALFSDRFIYPVLYNCIKQEKACQTADFFDRRRRPADRLAAQGEGGSRLAAAALYHLSVHKRLRGAEDEAWGNEDLVAMIPRSGR